MKVQTVIILVLIAAVIFTLGFMNKSLINFKSQYFEIKERKENSDKIITAQDEALKGYSDRLAQVATDKENIISLYNSSNLKIEALRASLKKKPKVIIKEVIKYNFTDLDDCNDKFNKCWNTLESIKSEFSLFIEKDNVENKNYQDIIKTQDDKIQVLSRDREYFYKKALKRFSFGVGATFGTRGWDAGFQVHYKLWGIL